MVSRLYLEWIGSVRVIYCPSINIHQTKLITILGDVGYLIAVKEFDSFHVVYHMADLFLPNCLSNLREFKSMLNTLFSFKHHNMNLQKTIKPATNKMKRERTLNKYRSHVVKRSPSSDPFFTPVQK